MHGGWSFAQVVEIKDVPAPNTTNSHALIVTNVIKLGSFPMNNIKHYLNIVKLARTFEIDHTPDGWPAIKMKKISELCDALETAMSELKEIKQQRDTLWSLADGAKTLIEIMPMKSNEVYVREVWRPNWLKTFKEISDQIFKTPNI